MDKITVVLADDHIIVREGTRQILEKEPDIKVVGEAGDGEEAVKLVTELRPNIAILDVAMPKLNGIEATKQIKAINPATAVLILSAYDNDQYVFALLEAGAAGYLLKNVRGRDLVEAVRAVYAGESVLHPTIARKVLERFVTTTPPTAKREQPSDALSDREMDVLRLAAKGKSNKEIAQEFSLSVRTVHAHFGNIFNKLKVGSRTEAIFWALKNGCISLDEIKS